MKSKTKAAILILLTIALATTMLTPLLAIVSSPIQQEAYTDWYTTSNTYGQDVAAGDIDNDGTEEIVTVNYYLTTDPWPASPSYFTRYGQIRIFNHTGTALQQECNYLWTNDTYYWREIFAVCIEDVNNDGRKEIITGGRIWELSPNAYEGEIAVWNWTGTTLIQLKYAKWSSPDNNLVYDVCAADVDNDGTVEIASTGTYHNDTTQISSELRIWNYTGITTPPATEYTKQVWTSEMLYLTSVTTADVDNDTQTEIITGGYRRSTTNYYIGQLKIWNWNGTTITLEKTEEWGTFTAGDSCVLYQVYAADLADDNGLTEIITVGYRNLTAYVAQVRIWNWNTTHMTLRQNKEWTGPTSAYVCGVYAKEVDSDDTLEIITLGTEAVNASFSQAQLRTWEWNGTAMLYEQEAKWGNVTTGLDLAVDDVDDDQINEILCIGNIQKTYWNAYLIIESIPDLIPPDIGTPEQNPTSPVEEGTPVGVRVYICDYGVGLENATLEYSTDNGSSWNPIAMSYNGTYDKWEATIPGQPAETAVQYRIVAFDVAENMQVEDNAGSYYVYSVIPEYTMLLPLLFMTATLIAFALTRTRKKP